MYIFRKLVKFVFSMYDNGLFHGDIKPDNIVLEPKYNDKKIYQIKIIDFAGASEKVQEKINEDKNMVISQKYTIIIFNFF